MPDRDNTLDQLLQVIVDPVRRQILLLLKEHARAAGKDSGLCGHDIELRVRLSQPTVSHHTKVLVRSGLVETRKLGQWKWYRRNEPALREFSRKLRASL
jgi:DNA-binding transcriptional ArsR family regulator